MKILINGKHADGDGGRILYEQKMDWIVDIPEELKDSPIIIQLNVASGGGATVNFGEIHKPDKG